MFTVLPFGLATACYIFTKLLRPLVRLWYKSYIVHIDDGIIVAPGLKQVRECSTVVRKTLEATGFVTNQAKCNCEPAQVHVWLGYRIELAEGRITIPVEKIVDLKGLLARAEKEKYLMATEIAGIVGKIISMSLLTNQRVIIKLSTHKSKSNHKTGSGALLNHSTLSYFISLESTH